MRIRQARFLLFAAALASLPACMAPGVPAAPAAAVGVAPAAIDGVPVPAAAPPATGIEKCCEALDRCRRKLCNTPFGQMINSMTKPVSALTGGVIPSFCPLVPGADDLAKPGVLGESAAVAKDAAEAKARRAAVRLLGTVDCRYYPEVEGKLLAALRTDGSECVRYEAAIALSHGCCCSKKVIDILTICVDGGEEDGAPAERSERVRDTAMIALQRCLSCVKVVEEPVVAPVPDPMPPVVPEDEIDAPKKPIKPKDGDTLPNPQSNKPDKKSVAKAKEVIARRQVAQAEAKLNKPAQPHSVYEMFKYAEDGPSISSTATPMPVIVATPAAPENFRVARPVNPLQQSRRMPVMPTAPMPVAQPMIPTPPAAIQATVTEPVLPEIPAPVISSGATVPVIPAEPLPTVPVIEPQPAPAAEPLPVPAGEPMPVPEAAPPAVKMPAVPEAPAIPAIPMVEPAPMAPAEPTAIPPTVIIRPETPALPPTHLETPEEPAAPPTVIIRPPVPAAPLPTSPFPD